MNFWGIWQFAQNKSAAKDLIEFLMQPENVDARSTAVMGYDLSELLRELESMPRRVRRVDIALVNCSFETVTW